MTRKRANVSYPWPSPEQVQAVLELTERAIETHQAQAVRMARDVTLGAITPQALAEETQSFYKRLSCDWSDALRILFREPRGRRDD